MTKVAHPQQLVGLVALEEISPGKFQPVQLEGVGGALNVNAKLGGWGITPSNYDGITGVLTAVGGGYSLASGASKLSIGVQTALAGPLLIAFGVDAADAAANVDGTVGSEVGMIVDLPVGDGVGKTAVVPIPPAFQGGGYAIAENHAVPTGKVIVTQGA